MDRRQGRFGAGPSGAPERAGSGPEPLGHGGRLDPDGANPDPLLTDQPPGDPTLTDLPGTPDAGPAGPATLDGVATDGARQAGAGVPGRCAQHPWAGVHGPWGRGRAPWQEEGRRPGPPGPWPDHPWAWTARPWRTGRRLWREAHGPWRRSSEGRVVAGVAAGIGRRFGVDPTLIRVGLALSVLASGFGVVGYVVAWLVLPLDGGDRSIAGRAGSDRRGITVALAFAPLLVLALIVSAVFHNQYLSTLAVTTVLSAAGLVLIGRNADVDERGWLRHLGRTYLSLFAVPGPRRSLATRIALGVLLWLGGMSLLAVGHNNVAIARPLVGLALLASALAMVFGPWWLRVGQDLITERQGRIRAEERADMAARIHDSVLQTLALIQRNSEDSQKVAWLARSQERELRSWLFEGRPPGSFDDAALQSVAAGVEHIAREVEEAHGVTVEAVTVGDCPLDEDLGALLAAGREATVNAAKWSKAPTVSLYAEVEAEKVSMFVRDRGVGFDPDRVAPDRRGLAESVHGRMARHGGTAQVRSSLGQGTEVELQLPRHRATP